LKGGRGYGQIFVTIFGEFCRRSARINKQDYGGKMLIEFISKGEEEGLRVITVLIVEVNIDNSG